MSGVLNWHLINLGTARHHLLKDTATTPTAKTHKQFRTQTNFHPHTHNMKQIKSKAMTAWVREANRAKYNAIERLIHIPGDTVDNSIERLQLLIKDANRIIFEMERDRQFINDNRNTK